MQHFIIFFLNTGKRCVLSSQNFFVAAKEQVISKGVVAMIEYAFTTGTLTKTAVIGWINEEKSQCYTNLSDKDIDSIAEQLMRIYWGYQNRNGNLGGFLEAVLSNNLKEAVFKSDIPSRKGLVLFAYFMQRLPASWRERMGY